MNDYSWFFNMRLDGPKLTKRAKKRRQYQSYHEKHIKAAQRRILGLNAGGLR